MSAVVTDDYFKRILERAPVCIHELDARGIVRSMNDTGLCWLEKSADEILGRPFVHLVDPEFHAVVHEAIGQALGGESATFIYRAHDDFGGRYFNSSIVPLAEEDPHERRLIGMSADITMLESLQSARRAAALKNRQLEQVSSDLRRLNQVTARTDAGEPKALLEAYLATAVAICGLQYGIVTLLEGRTVSMLTARSAPEGLPAVVDAAGSMTEAVQGRTLIASNDPEDDYADLVRGLARECDSDVFVAMPWQARERQGAIILWAEEPDRRLIPPHPEVIEVIRRDVAVLVELSHLGEERRQKEVEINSLFDLSKDLLCVVGSDGYFKRVSQSWTEVLGYSEQTLLSTPLVDLIHPEDREAALLEHEEGFPRRLVTNRYRASDGTYRWLEWSWSGIEGNRSYAIARDVTEERRTRRDLEMHARALASMGEGVLVVSSAGTLLQANSAAGRLLGTEAIRPGVPATEMAPEFEGILESLRHRLESCQSASDELEVHMASGEPRTVRVTGTTFGSLDEGFLVLVVDDITQARAAHQAVRKSLREKELLLKEIHHRVKNNLQVVSSLLRLQAGAVEDRTVARGLLATQDRVRSMAMIHERLYRTENVESIRFDEYLEELGESLARSYDAGGQGIELKFDLAPVHLDLSTAVSCGLIVNEVISNAMKHAFRGRDRGRIRLRLRRGRGLLTVDVSDDGVGLPEQTEVLPDRGLGMELVRALCQQLGARYSLESAAGTRFTMSFAGGHVD